MIATRRGFRRILLSALVAAPACLAAEPLTFQAALQLATRSSPDVSARTASVESARAASTAAGRLPDPKLAVGVENVPATGPDQWSLTRDFMTMRKIGLMQEVPNGGKRAARAAEAEASIERSRAERLIGVLQIRRDAALAWLERFFLERRGALFDELDRENQLFSQAVQAQLTGGRGMPADAVVPKQEAAELGDRRDEWLSELAKAKARLRRWVGAAGEEPLAGEPPAFAIDPGKLREHVHEHADLAVFVPMTQLAQAQVHEAEAMKRPDWGVELAYARRGSAFSDMVSLQLTFDLPVFPRTRQDPQIAARRQELARIEAEREAMLRDHTQDLEADLAEYDVLTRQLGRAHEVHLPLAREKVDFQFASYRAGKTDLGNVLGARRELIEARLREIELEGRRAMTAARVYYMYGAGAAEAQVTMEAEGGK